MATHNQPFDYAARCRRVRESLRNAGIDALLVGPSSDLFYLIGLNRPQSERLTHFILPAAEEETPRLILPSFETALAEPLAQFFDLLPWEETESPFELFAASLPAARAGQPLRLAVADQIYAHFLYRLQAAAPQAEFLPGGDLLNPVRMVKEAQELEYLTQAGAAADRTYMALLELPLMGMSEAEVKQQLMTLLPQHGHDPGAPAGAIVGVGENGASPHHHVGPRRIRSGDAVVVDFGGGVNGYWSDMTRSFHVGPPSDEYRRVYDLVNETNQVAFEAVRPGVTAESIDAVARAHIIAAGYEEGILHRTGHGLGFDLHEAPYIIQGDTTVLQEGMVFSIEPGIYLKGRFGVRIEDIVTVTADGARRFNLSTHDLQVL